MPGGSKCPDPIGSTGALPIVAVAVPFSESCLVGASSEQARTSGRRIGYALLMLAISMWAGNSIIGRLSAEERIPPLTLNFWRWVCASFFFALFFGRETWRRRHAIAASWKFILPFSLISIAGFNSVFYIALQRNTVLQVSLIQSILPVLVLLLCYAVLRERITPRQWWGVVLSVTGAAVVVLRGDPGILRSLRPNVGDLWALAAVTLWALQAFLVRWKPPEIPIMPFMTSISLIGVAAMAPFFAWELSTAGPMPVTRTSLLFVLYLGLMASFVGTTCWNEGTYRAGAAQAGHFGNLFPVFASGLAIAILGEELRWYHLAAAVLVVGGIRLAHRATDAART